MTHPDRSHAVDLPIFKGLSIAQTGEVLREARIFRYKRGETVLTEGEDAHSLFVLLQGHLRVSRLTPDGQQVVVRYISSAEVFGLAVVTGRSAYEATAIAAVDSAALLWPASAWPRFLATYPALGATMLRVVGSRLEDAQRVMIEISTQQVERRIAHALLRLARQAGRAVELGIEIDFPISRQHVAEMIGATLHTVSRVLSAWEDHGLVASGRQKITLRKPSQLRSLAEGDAKPRGYMLPRTAHLTQEHRISAV